MTEIRRLVINGVEYDSVASVPTELRLALTHALAEAKRQEAARELARRREAAQQEASGFDADDLQAGHRRVSGQAPSEVSPATHPDLPPEFFLRAGSSDPKDHPVYRQVQRWGYAFAIALALFIFLFIFLFR
ncbi:MAG: hypothetical protein WEA09_06225 [Gemmatimonadota bacterium]